MTHATEINVSLETLKLELLKRWN